MTLTRTSAFVLFAAAPLAAAVLGQGDVVDVAFAPDGNRIAVTRAAATEIWDATMRHRIALIPNGGGPVAWSLDGQRIGIGGLNASAWELKGPSRLWLGHTDNSSVTVVFSPTPDRVLYSSNYGAAIDRIEPVSGVSLNGGQAYQAIWSPRGNLVAVLVANAVQIWDPDSRKLIRSIATPIRGNNYQRHWGRMAWSPAEPELAIANELNQVEIWDAVGGRKLATMDGGSGGKQIGLNWSQDGQRIALAKDQALLVWHTRSGMRIEELALPASFDCASFAPKLDRAVTAMSAGEFELWDLSTRRSEHRSSQRAVWNYLAWAPAEPLLAAWGGAGVGQIWDAQTEQLRAEFPMEAWGIQSVLWTVDGKNLVSAERDGTVALRDTLTGKIQRRLEGARAPIYAINESPDGTRMAALAAGSLWVWSLSQQTSPPRELPIAGSQLAWSTNQTILVITMNRLLVEVDAEDGRRLWSKELKSPQFQQPWLAPNGRAYADSSGPGVHIQTLWVREQDGQWKDWVQMHGGIFSCTPNGWSACGGLDAGPTIYDLRNKELLRFDLPDVHGPPYPPYSIAISSAPRSLAIGAAGSIRVLSEPSPRR
jgi:WD40 repeat protein